MLSSTNTRYASARKPILTDEHGRSDVESAVEGPNHVQAQASPPIEE